MIQEKWFVTTKKAEFNQIGEKYHISPVIARIIRNRNVISMEDVDYFLNGTLKDLHDPHLMKDLDKACEILFQKIKEKKSIRIIGDYDVDGICSSYILKKGLEVLSADVSATIPHRIKDGYGLNENLIDEAVKDGVDTILTCDNGIAAANEIAHAKENNITVIITDHHEIPYKESTGEDGSIKKEEVLPKADAVVDPKREDCPYPFKGICGAVVAFKLMTVLFEIAKENDFISSDQAEMSEREMLEFAALATICDVMDLLDENRIIVKYGLKAMEDSQNQGLKNLIEISGLKGQILKNYHAGFIIGPCLNATGRLDSAERALELLSSQSNREAVVLASDLKQMNESRKELTENGVKQAIKQVESGMYDGDKVMVIYLPECHESIAGIIAGRLREKYCKPFFVLTDAEQGLKGSGRSIEAYHMYEGLHKVEDLLTKYGGHKLAAGLSLKKENLEEFRRRLNQDCDLTEEDFVRKITIDVPMPIPYASQKFVEELNVLEPFGNGNPKPVFAQKGLSIENCSVRGKNRNVAGFLLKDDSGYAAEGIYFGEADKFREEVQNHKGRINIVYYPDINEFRGQKKLQIVVTNYNFSV